jgi:hypothetical protein
MQKMQILYIMEKRERECVPLLALMFDRSIIWTEGGILSDRPTSNIIDCKG